MKRIAVDVGGTNLRVAWVTENYDIIYRKEYPATPSGEDDPGPVALMDSITEAIHSFMEEFKIDPSQAKGIGVSTGGIVNPHNGMMMGTASRKVAYENYPLAEELRKKLPVTNIRVENDAKAAAFGELKYGGAKGIHSFIYCGVGTGIGGAIVIRDELLDGADYSAGHYGRFSVRDVLNEETGYEILELISSGSGMEHRAEKYLAKGMESSVPSPVHAKDLFSEAKKGDAMSQLVLKEAAEALASVLSGLVCSLGIQNIVIGGGVAMKNSDWVEDLISTFRRIAPKMSADATFYTATLGEDAGLVGAAALLER